MFPATSCDRELTLGVTIDTLGTSRRIASRSSAVKLLVPLSPVPLRTPPTFWAPALMKSRSVPAKDQRYRRNPESVDPETRKAFENWTPETPSAAATGATPAGVDTRVIVGAANLVESIRRYGHLAAHARPARVDARRRSVAVAARARHHGRGPEAPAGVARRRAGRRGVGQRLRGHRKAAPRLLLDDRVRLRAGLRARGAEWLRQAAESGRFLPPMDPGSA